MTLKTWFVTVTLLTLAAILPAGCCGTECEQASGKLSECIGSQYHCANTCVGRELCFAKCVNAVSCEVIMDERSQSPTDKSKDYRACKAECEKLAPTPIL